MHDGAQASSRPHGSARHDGDAWMRPGNLRGLWQPANAGSKRLLIGSHIDTVPDAGAFDGVLGVVMALEYVELAKEMKTSAGD